VKICDELYACASVLWTRRHRALQIVQSEIIVVPHSVYLGKSPVYRLEKQTCGNRNADTESEENPPKKIRTRLQNKSPRTDMRVLLVYTKSAVTSTLIIMYYCFSAAPRDNDYMGMGLHDMVHNMSYAYKTQMRLR